MNKSLWSHLGQLAAAERVPLAAAGAVLLAWGLVREQGWLLPVAAVLLLAALTLRWLWYRLRPDTLDDPRDFSYPEEVFLPEEGEDLDAYFSLAEQLAGQVAGEAAEEMEPPEEERAELLQPRPAWWLWMLLAGLTLLYCLAQTWLGWLPATYGYLCLLLWLLGENHGVVVALVPAVLSALAALIIPFFGITL